MMNKLRGSLQVELKQLLALHDPGSVAEGSFPGPVRDPAQSRHWRLQSGAGPEPNAEALRVREYLRYLHDVGREVSIAQAPQAQHAALPSLCTSSVRGCRCRMMMGARPHC